VHTQSCTAIAKGTGISVQRHGDPEPLRADAGNAVVRGVGRTAMFTLS
jgi:hypothetical protein